MTLFPRWRRLLAFPIPIRRFGLPPPEDRQRGSALSLAASVLSRVIQARNAALAVSSAGPVNFYVLPHILPCRLVCALVLLLMFYRVCLIRLLQPCMPLPAGFFAQFHDRHHMCRRVLEFGERKLSDLHSSLR